MVYILYHDFSYANFVQFRSFLLTFFPQLRQKIKNKKNKQKQCKCQCSTHKHRNSKGESTLTIYDPWAHVKKNMKKERERNRRGKTTISTISAISIKPIKSVDMQLTFMARRWLLLLSLNPAGQADKAT